MNTIADDVFLRIFQGSESIYQTEKSRRPYHRNCSCEMHKSKDNNTPSCVRRNKNIQMKKKKKSWYDNCSLSVETPKFILFEKNKEEENALKIGRIDQWILM
ncbi:hypothetical protein ABFS83_10G121100 [Erythranthe nasuta]